MMERTAREPTTPDRLARVLTFLSVGGGAALLSKRDRRVLASVGAFDATAVTQALDARIEPDDAVIHVDRCGLVAEVGRRHRLLVLVPLGLPSPAFADRLRRARALVERF